MPIPGAKGDFFRELAARHPGTRFLYTGPFELARPGVAMPGIFFWRDGDRDVPTSFDLTATFLYWNGSSAGVDYGIKLESTRPVWAVRDWTRSPAMRFGAKSTGKPPEVVLETVLATGPDSAPQRTFGWGGNGGMELGFIEVAPAVGGVRRVESTSYKWETRSVFLRPGSTGLGATEDRARVLVNGSRHWLSFEPVSGNGFSREFADQVCEAAGRNSESWPDELIAQIPATEKEGRGHLTLRNSPLLGFDSGKAVAFRLERPEAYDVLLTEESGGVMLNLTPWTDTRTPPQSGTRVFKQLMKPGDVMVIPVSPSLDGLYKRVAREADPLVMRLDDFPGYSVRLIRVRLHSDVGDGTSR